MRLVVNMEIYVIQLVLGALKFKLFCLTELSRTLKDLRESNGSNFLPMGNPLLQVLRVVNSSKGYFHILYPFLEILKLLLIKK